jgi:hypothetical protein
MQIREYFERLTASTKAKRFIDEFTQFCTEVADRTNRQSEETVVRYALLIFVRLVESTKAARLLLGKNFHRQSEVLLRTALEGFLHLRALANYPDLHEAWGVIAAIHTRQRYSKARKLGKTELNDGVSIDDAIVEVTRQLLPKLPMYLQLLDRLDEIKNEKGERIENRIGQQELENTDSQDNEALLNLKVPDIQTWEMALLAERELGGQWPLLCESAHFNLRQVVEDHLRTYKDGDVVLSYSTNPLRIPQSVHEWFDVLMHSVAALSDLQDDVFKAELDEWHDRWKKELEPMLD